MSGQHTSILSLPNDTVLHMKGTVALHTLEKNDDPAKKYFYLTYEPDLGALRVQFEAKVDAETIEVEKQITFAEFLKRHKQFRIHTQGTIDVGMQPAADQDNEPAAPAEQEDGPSAA